MEGYRKYLINDINLPKWMKTLNEFIFPEIFYLSKFRNSIILHNVIV